MTEKDYKQAIALIYHASKILYKEYRFLSDMLLLMADYLAKQTEPKSKHQCKANASHNLDTDDKDIRDFLQYVKEHSSERQQ
jgi:HJR/Mrr/RecB family endonuclease